MSRTSEGSRNTCDQDALPSSISREKILIIRPEGVVSKKLMGL